MSNFIILVNLKKTKKSIIFNKNNQIKNSIIYLIVIFIKNNID